MSAKNPRSSEILNNFLQEFAAFIEAGKIRVTKPEYDEELAKLVSTNINALRDQLMQDELDALRWREFEDQISAALTNRMWDGKEVN